MPFLSLPPRFWALLGTLFFAVLAWRATRRWWTGFKRDARHARDAWRSNR